MSIDPIAADIWFQICMVLITVILFETGALFFTVGFVMMFFISKTEWGLLHRDFELYWPRISRENFGDKGKYIFVAINIAALITLTLIKR